MEEQLPFENARAFGLRLRVSSQVCQRHRVGRQFEPYLTADFVCTTVAQLSCGLGCCNLPAAVVRRRFRVAQSPRNNIPGHTTRAPPVGFELATKSIQFYAIAELDKTSLYLSSANLNTHLDFGIQNRGALDSALGESGLGSGKIFASLLVNLRNNWIAATYARSSRRPAVHESPEPVSRQPKKCSQLTKRVVGFLDRCQQTSAIRHP